MGDTTENLGQSINVTFAVDNENSRNTPSNPHVLPKDVNQGQSQGDNLVALSDKLYKQLEQKQLIRHCSYKARSLIHAKIYLGIKDKDKMTILHHGMVSR